MAEFGVAAHWMYKSARRPDGRRAGAARRTKLEVAALDDRVAAGRSPTRASSWRRCASTCSRTRSSCSRPRARSSRWRPARRRSTSPTRCTPTSATTASAPRSTARSCRCTTSCARATSSRSSRQARARAVARLAGDRQDDPARATRSRQWFKAESREDSEHTGRELLQEHLQQAGPAGAEDRRLGAAGRRDPRDGLPQGRGLLHRARRRRRSRRRSSSTRSCSASSRARRPTPRRRADGPVEGRRAVATDELLEPVRHRRRGRRGRDAAHGEVLPAGAGRSDRRLHIAGPRDHDPPRGLPERAAVAAQPGTLHGRHLGRRPGRPRSASRCTSTPGIATTCSADLSRAFSESGVNILEARCLSSPPMVKNRFVVEVGDTQSLKGAITRLRNIESVFDAYRVTPGAAA